MKTEVFEITITGKYLSLCLPENKIKAFLDKKIKRVKVKASFEGKEIEFHAAIQKRGELHYMMFSKAKQKELGVFQNDYFQLQLCEDKSKYGVEMPEELDAVLKSDYEAYKIFESFTAGKKRGIIYMIRAYKNSQTKIDKSLILCENLKQGIKENKYLLRS